jgi:hypothetical protein
MNLTSAVLLVAVISGCASRVDAPLKSAHESRALGSERAHKTVEVRHFYLLAPGPNSVLVVTRSDVPEAAR